MWDPRHPPNHLLEEMEAFNLAVDSEVVVCAPEGRGTGVGLWAVKKLYYDLPLSARPLSAAEGTSSSPRTHNRGRQSLTGLVIRTICVVRPFTNGN